MGTGGNLREAKARGPGAVSRLLSTRPDPAQAALKTASPDEGLVGSNPTPPALVLPAVALALLVACSGPGVIRPTLTERGGTATRMPGFGSVDTAGNSAQGSSSNRGP